MDFIGSFDKSVFGNTYIYNLVDYFSKHIYPHPTPSAGKEIVIPLFDHYLQFSPKFNVVYKVASIEKIGL